MPRSRSALISVYNKEGIVPFAQALIEQGFMIYSSGGTAKALRQGGIETVDVADLVGGGAILGHRVVTLSREVHAGLLAQYDLEADIKEMEKLGLPYIDLVCNDVYPLKQEITRPGSTLQSVIEQTDIGGPCMLRSAAKGGRIVICTVEDRARVLEWLAAGEPDHDQFIEDLRAKSEAYVADYVLASARYHGNGAFEGFVGQRVLTCKYGENGYQTPAALYSTGSDDPLALDKFEVVTGTDPSYNNLCDVDRLLQTMTHVVAGQQTYGRYGEEKGFENLYVVVAAKHGNPCGAAVSFGPIAAEWAIEGDLRAVFGGLVMLNHEVDEHTAEVLLTHEMPAGQRRLLDGIIAPGFTEGAIGMLRRKKDKCRLLANPALANLSVDSLDTATRIRYVRGGFLSQPNYTFVPKLATDEVDGPKFGIQNQYFDLMLAWAVGATSNSNTITLVKGWKLIGNGVGQQDRVGCAELAVKRARDAGHDTEGAVAYSDSFFPFVDGVEVLAKAGIKAILTSSGSVRDNEVKAFCRKHDIVLHLVPDSAGRGFFGH